jgi:hypothetical protein
VDNLSIEVSRLLFTAEAAAAASSAAVFVPMESAIKLILNLRQHFTAGQFLIVQDLLGIIPLVNCFTAQDVRNL